MDIRQRLHLSGMDSHAPELARKWGLGLEVTDFCYAPMLDDPATLPAVREKMAGIDHFWLHAPFAELAPCAVDPLVREVTARRYRQALSAARQLGIRRLVIHSGYIPLVYFPEWFTEQSVAFWREFLPEVPEDMVLALENVMDETPSADDGHRPSGGRPPAGPVSGCRPRQYLRQPDTSHGVDRPHGPLSAARTSAQQLRGLGSPQQSGRRQHPYAADTGGAAGAVLRRPHGPSKIRTAPRPLHGWCSRAISARSDL